MYRLFEDKLSMTTNAFELISQGTTFKSNIIMLRNKVKLRWFEVKVMRFPKTIYECLCTVQLTLTWSIGIPKEL